MLPAPGQPAPFAMADSAAELALRCVGFGATELEEGDETSQVMTIHRRYIYKGDTSIHTANTRYNIVLRHNERPPIFVRSLCSGRGIRLLTSPIFLIGRYGGHVALQTSAQWWKGTPQYPYWPT